MRLRRLTVGCALVTSAAVSLALAPAALAASIVVDTAADENGGPGPVVPGGCSLREATVSANNDTATGGCSAGDGADTITFTPAVVTIGTIDLATVGTELVVDSTEDDDLTIQGPGSGELEVTNTNAAARIFNLASADEAVQISGLAITSGNVDGDAVQQGGGIRSESPLTLVDVELRDNTISADGDSLVDGVASAEGGAIWAASDLTVEDSVIEENDASADNSDADVNFVFAGGGGIQASFLNVRNSRIADNTATVNDQSVDTDTVDQAIGAGILAGAEAAIEQSSISGNSAFATGLTGGVEAKGAGIRLAGGSGSRIELSTIAGNSAVGSGATSTDIWGAGVLVVDNPMPVVSSTIAENGENTVDVAGANLFAEGAGEAIVSNTIVAAPVGLTEGGTSNCSGAVSSNGFNVDYEPAAVTSSCNFTDPTDLLSRPGDIPSIDPMLGALAANGGIGQTMLPQPGSPVIDQGDSGAQTIADEDQRQAIRPALFDDISNAPLGDGSDIGATEIPIAPPIFASTDPASPNDDDTPNVLGTLAVYSPVTAPIVQLFTNPACTVASGAPTSAGDFFDPGIATGPLPHSATTTFYGKVETDYGVSHCSTGLFPNTISYTNTLVDPVPPVVSPPPVTTTPAPAKKKKCKKKGFVRKKGKCVKKKRKKKKG